MARFIGLDIGGTKFMAAAADESGRIIHQIKVDNTGSLENDLELLDRLTESLAGGESIAGIGAAIGGPLDWKTGVVSPLHQPAWRNVPLKQRMEEKYQCRFVVDVDTNVAVLGEYATVEKNFARFLYITLSTGMGGGLLLDGKVYRGMNGSHPEIAHQSIPYRCSNPSGLYCECGIGDCLEALVSGNAIRRLYGKPAQNLTGTEWNEVAYNLGQGLRNLAVIYTPDIISIGGGVAVGGGDSFIRAAECVMKDHIRLTPIPEVYLSKLGYDTALIGALWIARFGLS